MDIPDFELDDVVIFELPTVEAVEAFRKRFRPRWDGWSDADGQVWLFTARLHPEADLAVLLREAHELSAELGLADVRFCLDGRLYVLDAPRPRRAADLAARA
jgi:hypothetical protein